MNSFLSRRAALGLAANACALAALPAWAQSDRALRVILPIGAGSGVDTIVRAALPSLIKVLGGQAVMIDNLPGAGGITGASALSKAPADGFTLGVVSNNHVINPSVYKKMPYDTLGDFTPISVLGSTPFVLAVNPGKGRCHQRQGIDRTGQSQARCLQLRIFRQWHRDSSCR